MSLILDALRRADTERERERGAVPGLHAQQAAAYTSEARRPAGARPWAWLAIAALAGLLVAFAAWQFAGRQPAGQAAAPAVPAPASPVPAVAPAAAAAPSGAAAPSRSGSAEPQPVAEPAPWPGQDGGRKATAATAPQDAHVPPASSASLVAAIPTREQLPEDVRSQLPPLAVGGSIYSSNAPDRSVIIDGRIARENDRLGAELTLEQIRPKSAVLRFRGHRFEIAL